MQNNPQQILFLSETIRRVILPAPVHVIRFPDMLLVKIDICDGIKPVKMKQYLILLLHLFIGIKAHLIFIIIFHQGKGTDLVILPEGILHIAVTQQIRIDRPRYDRRL